MLACLLPIGIFIFNYLPADRVCYDTGIHIVNSGFSAHQKLRSTRSLKRSPKAGRKSHEAWFFLGTSSPSTCKNRRRTWPRVSSPQVRLPSAPPRPHLDHQLSQVGMSAICFAGAKNELASLASKGGWQPDLDLPTAISGIRIASLADPAPLPRSLTPAASDVDVYSIALRGGLTTLAPIIATGITRRNCRGEPRRRSLHSPWRTRQ